MWLLHFRVMILQYSARQLVHYAWWFLQCNYNMSFLSYGEKLRCSYNANPLVPESFCHKFDLREIVSYLCTFLQHAYARLFQTNTLFNWWVNISGHVITTELATPISELKPLNCCDLGFLGQTLTPADWYKNLVMTMWVYNTVWTSSSARMSFPGTLKPHNFKKWQGAAPLRTPPQGGTTPLKISPLCTF